MTFLAFRNSGTPGQTLKSSFRLTVRFYVFSSPVIVWNPDDWVPHGSISSSSFLGPMFLVPSPCGPHRCCSKFTRLTLVISSSHFAILCLTSTFYGDELRSLPHNAPNNSLVTATVLYFCWSACLRAHLAEDRDSVSHAISPGSPRDLTFATGPYSILRQCYIS